MRFLKFILPAAMVLASIAPSLSQTDGQRYIFRYTTGNLTAPVPSPNEPEQPVNPDDFDVTARFYGVAGESFQSTIPTKPGATVISWSIEKGFLPEGLVLDPSSGMISGTPTEETVARMLAVVGHAPTVEMGTRASVRIDIASLRDGAVRQDFYARTNRPFFAAIPNGGEDVHEWNAVVPLPEWASVSNGFVSGTPDAAGSWPFAMSGVNYSGHEVAFAYGSVLVEDGPSVAFIEDQHRHVADPFSILPSVERAVGNIVWDISEGILPAGLLIDRETGAITGTIPQFSTSTTIVLRATDLGDGTTGLSNPFTLSTADPAVGIRDLRDLHFTVNSEHHHALEADETVGQQIWAVVEGELPPGISIDEGTGTIGGTATHAGEWKGVVVRVSTPSGSDESPAFAIHVHGDMLTASVPATHERIGTPFLTAAPVASGGTGPYTFEAAEGSDLPAGVMLDNGTGVLSGVFTERGDRSVSLVPVDSTGRRGSAFTAGLYAYGPLETDVSQDLYVFERLSPAVPITPSVPEFSAIPPVSWSIMPASALPQGLSFNPETGRVSGVPTAGSIGTYGPFMIEVSDASGSTADTETFTIQVIDIPQMEATASDVTFPRLVSSSVQAARSDHAVGQVTYALDPSSEPLPDGLHVLADGRIAGRTFASEAHQGIVLRATDSEGRTAATAPFMITLVQPGAMEASNVTMTWAQDVAFTTPAPEVMNPVGAVTWEAMSALPPELSLDTSTGRLSGTLSVPGAYGPYTLSAQDSMGRTASSSVTVAVLAPMQVSIASAAHGNRLSPLEPFRPVVTNGVGRLAWDIGGTLPEGVSFDAPTGFVSGTPLEEGTFPVEFTVTDAAGQTRTVETMLDVGARNPLSIRYSDITLVNGRALKRPVMPLEPMNAAGSVAFTLEEGSLPPGVLFNRTTGGLSGTPSEAGIWDGIVISGTDSENVRDESDPFSIKVTLDGTITLADPTVRKARIDGHFTSDAVSVGNVHPPVAFSAEAGGPLSDPDGIVLIQSTGQLTGVATTAGARSYSLNVKDGLERNRDFVLRLEVVGDLSVSRGDLSVPLYGNLSARPILQNAVGRIGFDLQPLSSLPQGVSFDSANGGLYGTPEEEGTFGPFTLEAEDFSDGSAATATFMLTVGPRNPLTVLFDGVDVPLYGSLDARGSASGNAGSVSWSLSPAASELPEGIEFDQATARFHGTPLEEGTFGPFTLSATDARGGTDSVVFPVTVGPRVPLAIAYGTYNTQLGRQFGPVNASVTGNHGTVSYSLADPFELPPGISFASDNGGFHGVATHVGQYEVHVTAHDSTSSATGLATIRVSHGGEMKVSSAPPLRARNGSALSMPAPTVTGGVAPLVFSADGALSGLVLDPAAGTLQGAISAPGTHSFDLRATDLFGKSVAFTRQVEVVDDLAASFGDPGLTVLANHPYSLAPQVSGVLGTLAWSLDSGALPNGITLNSSTGALEGNTDGSEEAMGTWPGIVVRATDSDGQTAAAGPVTISVVSDGEPITLVTQAITTKPGFAFATQVPLVGNAIGDYSFRSPNADALGLDIDPMTGVISGTLLTHGNRVIDVDVTDSTTRVTSEPQQVDVLPLMRLTVNPHTMIPVRSAMEPIMPAVQYAVGMVSYELDGELPEGMTFSPANGRITGTPVEQGLSEPLRIFGTDTLGDRQPSNVFRIEVIDDGSIPTVSLPTFSPAKVGVEMADLVPIHGAQKKGDVFTLNQPLPAGLDFDPATGTISGTPSNGSHGLNEGYVMRVTDVNGRYSETPPFPIGIRHQDDVFYSDNRQDVRSGINFALMLPLENLHAVIGTPRYVFGNNSQVYSGTGYRIEIDSVTGELTGYTNRSLGLGVRLYDDIGMVFSGQINLRLSTLSISLQPQVFEANTRISIHPAVTGVMGMNTKYVLQGQNGVLPDGVSIDETTGEISGLMPFGTYSVRIGVTDAGQTAWSGWMTLRGTSSAPLSMEFGSLADQMHGTVVESEIVGVTGVSVDLAANVSPPTASAFRICYDPSCLYVKDNWSTASKTVRNGEFVQMRVTVPEESLQARTLRLTVGGISADWTVASASRVMVSYPTTTVAVLPVAASEEVYVVPTVTSSNGPVSYSPGSGFPDTLTLDANTGVITGTAPYASNTPVTVIVSDDVSENSASFLLTGRLACASIALPPSVSGSKSQYDWQTCNHGTPQGRVSRASSGTLHRMQNSDSAGAAWCREAMKDIGIPASRIAMAYRTNNAGTATSQRLNSSFRLGSTTSGITTLRCQVNP